MPATAKPQRLTASEERPIDLQCEALPADESLAEIVDASIEAAGEGGDGERLPTFRAKVYNGSPMRPRVRNYDSGGLPILIDLQGARIARGGNKTPVLYAHDRTDPIGHTTRIDVAGSEITAEGVLSVPGASRDKVAGGAKAGFRWAVSIGFQATELEYISRSDSATVNGRVVRGPMYIARKGDVHEISLLPIGAERTAAATVSATSGDSTPEPFAMSPELRAYIEAAGFNPDDLNESQVKHFESQYAASIEAEPDGEPPETDAGAGIEASPGDEIDPVAEMRRRSVAELNRQNRITDICAEYNNPTQTINNQSRPIAAIAIEAGWDETKTELEAMRAARRAAPAAHSANSRSASMTIEAVQSGLMQRCGVDLENQNFRGVAAIEAGTPGWLNADVNADRFQQTAEAGRRFRGSHIMEILATVAEIETGNRPHGKNAILEAAFSTNSIANLFGTTVGARTLTAFREVNDTTAGWTSNGTVPDFEEHGRHSLESMEQLDHLPAGGEAGHAKRSDWKETVQAARYAKQYMIDEQDLIGDRLNLLTSTPAAMGRAAGRMRPDLVYGLLLANPTMGRTGRAAFHTTDGTLLSAAALSGTTLSTAIASLMKQKDGDATLNLQPTHLITGAELSDTVVQLLGSATLSNDSGKGANNPIARYGIMPVADARVSNGVVHPKTKVLQTGSATAWFLVSTDGETIEVLTVEGTGGVPVVMTTNLRGVGKFGLQIECKYDIGADFVENRTFRKNAGA